MRMVLLNQVITAVRQLDIWSTIDLRVNSYKTIRNSRWDNIELCQYAYYPVRYFDFAYNSLTKSYNVYIELNERLGE